MFPFPEESPAHHVRDLSIWIGGPNCVPEEFFEHHVVYEGGERDFVGARGGVPPFRLSLWKLPQSVTSFTIQTSVVTLVQIRDIMAQLPNLNDLSLSGTHIRVDGSALLGVGTTLRGKFGGQLLLNGGWVDMKDATNMLLEIPTGLHFTGVQIYATRERLLSTVRLAEACSKTLVKLLYSVALHGKSHLLVWLVAVHELSTLTTFGPNLDGSETLERAFDFSKVPNIQEVDFRVGWMGGGLLWIPTALSALRPTTSPRLSAIKLGLTSPLGDESVETMIEDAGGDLRRIADELIRIEREFEGAVNFTVRRDLEFKAVFDTLNVRFHFRGVNGAL